MPAYMIHLSSAPAPDSAHPEAMTETLDHIKTIVEAFGGHYLTRMGDAQNLAGDTDASRASVIEFPSMADLRAFYGSDQYRPFSRQRPGELIVVDSDSSR